MFAVEKTILNEKTRNEKKLKLKKFQIFIKNHMLSYVVTLHCHMLTYVMISCHMLSYLVRLQSKVFHCRIKSNLF